MNRVRRSGHFNGKENVSAKVLSEETPGPEHIAR